MKDGTADSIINAASELFSERGVWGTSLGDIAKAVGISKGTLYYHYPAKQDIVEIVSTRCISDIGDRILGWIDGISGDSEPRRALSELCEALLGEAGLRLFISIYNAAEPEGDMEASIDRAMSEWNVMLDVGALRMRAGAAAKMKRIAPAIIPFLCGLAALNADMDYAKAAFTAFVLG